MPKITALLHTHNDEASIARALESLRACDEILVVDHASTDRSKQVASRHGAMVKEGVPGVNRGVYAVDARYDWILCLLATEAVSEPMEVALLEWKASYEDKDATLGGFRFALREEGNQGSINKPPEMRLVNRTRVNWTDDLPPNDPDSPMLSGHVLRFQNP